MWRERLWWWVFGRRIAMARQHREDAFAEAEARRLATIAELQAQLAARLAARPPPIPPCYVMKSVAELLGE